MPVIEPWPHLYGFNDMTGMYPKETGASAMTTNEMTEERLAYAERVAKEIRRLPAGYWLRELITDDRRLRTELAARDAEVERLVGRRDFLHAENKQLWQFITDHMEECPLVEYPEPAS